MRAAKRRAAASATAAAMAVLVFLIHAGDLSRAHAWRLVVGSCLRQHTSLTRSASKHLRATADQLPWDLSGGQGLTSEHLICEEMVTDDQSASALADRSMAEARRLFASDANWRNLEVNSDVYVESIPLSGAYARSGVHLVRATGTIPCSAEKFFNFQISREGFKSIDEYLVNHRNLANFKWLTRPDCKHVTVPQRGEVWDEKSPYQLMLNRVEWKYPIKRREFVALDMVDRKDMILVSKSCLSPLRPGGSKYQSIVPMDENTPYIDPIDPTPRPLVRAVQYYASKVEPIDANSCCLKMLTWGEMCDEYPNFWVNVFNAHVFITPKFERFRRVMAGEKLEEPKLVDNAWRLLKIIPTLKPHIVAAMEGNLIQPSQ